MNVGRGGGEWEEGMEVETGNGEWEALLGWESVGKGKSGKLEC